MASKRKLDLGNVVGSKGDRGTTYVPNVSPTGDLSWSNDDGLENPATVNIKGERGERGEQGATGNAGEKGDKGDTGAVYTPTVSDAGDLSWTNNGGLPNPKTVNIKGEKGEKGDKGDTGAAGAAGKNGTSAYDAAKAGGYSGAEVEFNAILSIIDKHASRHAVGGADPLSYADIGAVGLTGGTQSIMTGQLLSNLGASSQSCGGGFVGTGDATYLEAYEDYRAVYDKRRQLVLRTMSSTEDDDTALLVSSFDGTTWRGYPVLHTGNLNTFVLPDDIGAIPKTGGTMTGTLIQKDITLTNGVNNVKVMQAYDDGDSNNYGSELTITANGNTYLGAGESATNLRNLLSAGGDTVANENYSQTAERLYLCADTEIMIETNCNTIANRKCILVNKSGGIVAPGGFIGNASGLSKTLTIETGGTNATTPQGALYNLGAKTNKNLLDNWYFPDPINQRGLQTYAKNEYSVDRWKLTAAANIALVDGGANLYLDSTSTYGQLVQFLPPETINAILGREITYSILSSDGLHTASTVVPSTLPSSSTDIINFMPTGTRLRLVINLNKSGSHVRCTVYNTSIADGVTIIAEKLEFGSTQTLARQDSSGNWVLLDPPPNKQQELAKCQRYFLPIKYGRFIGNANQYNCYSLVPTPVTMRSKPVATVSSNGTLCTTDSTLTISSTSVSQLMPNGILIVQLLSNSPLTKNVPAILYDPIISFSADL